MSHENALIARGQTHTRMASMQEQHFAISADNPRWMEAGSCQYVDPELWFPEAGGSVRSAKRVCAACPVKAECLEYALENKEKYGVWGALSERQRRDVIKKRAA